MMGLLLMESLHRKGRRRQPGASTVDLAAAAESLGKDFGIRTLLLEGGGHINGAFLQEGLIDEVNFLLVPGIDGRGGIVTVFDGHDPS